MRPLERYLIAVMVIALAAGAGYLGYERRWQWVPQPAPRMIACGPGPVAAPPPPSSAQLWVVQLPFGDVSQEAAVTELLRAQDTPEPGRVWKVDNWNIYSVSVDGSPITAESAAAATLVAPEEFASHQAFPRAEEARE